MVSVPDDRLDKLAKLSNSKKVVPAVVEFYDIAGLVRGAYKGEGLGNQFLSHIREVAVIVQVIRCFKNEEIIHVENAVDPLRDMEIIKTELILKDLETVNKRLGKAESEVKTGKKELVEQFEILKKIKKNLEEGKSALIPAIAGISADSINDINKELQLLTSKPVIYLLNGKNEDVPQNLLEAIKKERSSCVILDAVTSAVGFASLIVEAYKILGLVSFFTTGEDETRAWTISVGSKAPQAAGVIHTDFEKKFIRAEVINWQKLLDVGGWIAAKSRGVLRLEGKDYVVQDGDVMVIRHG